jgi:hypothetical protein
MLFCLAQKEISLVDPGGNSGPISNKKMQERAVPDSATCSRHYAFGLPSEYYLVTLLAERKYCCNLCPILQNNLKLRVFGAEG